MTDEERYERILQRITVMETASETTQRELHATMTELKEHIREEPQQFERIRMAIENAAKAQYKQIEDLAHDIQEIKIARSRDKGFWAGAIFVFTALGGVAATLWHKLHTGG